MQEFEKKERSLQQKLRDKEDEAAQCEAKIADFEAKLESKQEEVEASQQNKQAVMQVRRGGKAGGREQDGACSAVAHCAVRKTANGCRLVNAWQ